MSAIAPSRRAQIEGRDDPLAEAIANARAMRCPSWSGEHAEGSRESFARRHRRAWARKRLRAARLEARGETDRPALLRAEAAEHLEIARDLEADG